jgi:hypothetical protein
MRKAASIVGQGVLYAAFAAFVGLFSVWPAYRHLEPDQALLKLSFSHPGERIGECRQRTAEELAKLAPNMRALQDCPRERSPVSVELELDSKLLAQRVVPPSGLSRDGASTVYARFPVPAGAHRLEVKVDDSVRAPGATWQREIDLALAPGQVLVVDIDPEQGGIVIQ